MAHQAHRRLGGACAPGVGCIPVSVLAEESTALGNNCPNTDKLWDVVSRLSQAVGKHEAALADKPKHPKLAVIQAGLVSLDDALHKAYTRAAPQSGHEATLVALRAQVTALIDLVAEYRSA